MDVWIKSIWMRVERGRVGADTYIHISHGRKAK